MIFGIDRRFPVNPDCLGFSTECPTGGTAKFTGMDGLISPGGGNGRECFYHAEEKGEKRDCGADRIYPYPTGQILFAPK